MLKNKQQVPSHGMSEKFLKTTEKYCHGFCLCSILKKMSLVTLELDLYTRPVSKTLENKDGRNGNVQRRIASKPDFFGFMLIFRRVPVFLFATNLVRRHFCLRWAFKFSVAIRAAERMIYHPGIKPGWEMPWFTWNRLKQKNSSWGIWSLG